MQSSVYSSHLNTLLPWWVVNTKHTDIPCMLLSNKLTKLFFGRSKCSKCIIEATRVPPVAIAQGLGVTDLINLQCHTVGLDARNGGSQSEHGQVVHCPKSHSSPHRTTALVMTISKENHWFSGMLEKNTRERRLLLYMPGFRFWLEAFQFSNLFIILGAKVRWSFNVLDWGSVTRWHEFDQRCAANLYLKGGIFCHLRVSELLLDPTGFMWALICFFFLNLNFFSIYFCLPMTAFLWTVKVKSNGRSSEGVN